MSFPTGLHTEVINRFVETSSQSGIWVPGETGGEIMVTLDRKSNGTEELQHAVLHGKYDPQGQSRDMTAGTGAPSIWWEYIRGIWHIRRTRRVVIVADGTNVLIQVKRNGQGVETDHRVFLLWDNRPSGHKDAQVKVYLASAPNDPPITLTCSDAASECYTEINGTGDALTESELISESDHEGFVGAVKTIAAEHHIPDAFPGAELPGP